MKFNFSKPKTLFIICFIFCLGAFIPWFFVKQCWIDNWTIALSALGTVATLLALVIGILILDRYGLKGKFKEREMDAVYGFYDTLSKIRITIETEDRTDFITPFSMDHFCKSDVYIRVKSKLIAYNIEDYSKYIWPIVTWNANHFLPKSLKEKIEFLSHNSMSQAQATDDYIFLRLHSNEQAYIPDSHLTLDDFFKKLDEVVKDLNNRKKEYEI
jgi:hypothetical protein